jgi:hypothetical protein
MSIRARIVPGERKQPVEAAMRNRERASMNFVFMLHFLKIILSDRSDVSDGSDLNHA